VTKLRKNGFLAGENIKKTTTENYWFRLENADSPTDAVVNGPSPERPSTDGKKVGRGGRKDEQKGRNSG